MCNHNNSRARGTMILFKSNMVSNGHCNDKERSTEIHVVKLENNKFICITFKLRTPIMKEAHTLTIFRH